MCWRGLTSCICVPDEPFIVFNIQLTLGISALLVGGSSRSHAACGRQGRADLLHLR